MFLILPIISEKSMADAKKGRFTFKVSKTADKTEIRKKIEERFKVNVTGISTVITKGRTKTSGAKRIEREIASFKKAIVSLKDGQKIELFDVGGK